MVNSVDFAKYIVFNAQQMNIPLNLTQLQKITYICDGTLLALGHNIINEHCRVWEHGPVYPKIYKWYDKNRNKSLALTDISKDAIKEINSISDINKIVISALKKFGTWTAGQLSEWSHQPKSPWDIARSNNGMFSKIDKEDMKSYFLGIINVR